MAYFSNLFLAMEKIYQHLQILLFVLIGGFFTIQIGANKLQSYLENRGESSAKEPYLHKFYIPLLMIGLFFMPIPESNGIAHSTIIQNIIRTFAMHSTNIADMANTIGAKTYMDKIYKSIGSMNNEAILNFLLKKQQNLYEYQETKRIFEICQTRYEKISQINWQSFNFQTMNNQEKNKLREQYRLDINQQSLTKNDINLETCIMLQYKIYELYEQINKQNQQKEQNKNFLIQKQEIINNLDMFFNIQNKQMGWMSTTLIPSSMILAETLMFSNNTNVKKDMEMVTKQNKNNINKLINSNETTSGENEINDSNLGWFAGKLVWMILPGASSIQKFVENNITTIITALSSTIGLMSGSIVGSIAFGVGGFILSSLVGSISSYAITVYLMEITFQKIPLLVCSTASIIAFIAYLITLLKYFYVSSFIVAFSLATKKLDKIIEFLISGLAIFFKPILIILFIYHFLFIR